MMECFDVAFLFFCLLLKILEILFRLQAFRVGGRGNRAPPSDEGPRLGPDEPNCDGAGLVVSSVENWSRTDEALVYCCLHLKP